MLQEGETEWLQYFQEKLSDYSTFMYLPFSFQFDSSEAPSKNFNIRVLTILSQTS